MVENFLKNEGKQSEETLKQIKQKEKKKVIQKY